MRSCGTRENGKPLGPSQHVERDVLADLLAGQRPDQIIGACNGRAVETQHDVAGFEAGAVGGASRLDGADHHCVVLSVTGGAAQPCRNGNLLRRDSDEGTAYPAVPHQFAEHEVRGVRRNRKADALRTHDHGRVDADNLAVRGYKWPAGIAGIERCIGLDHVVDQVPVPCAERAAQCRDDARRHCGFEAERIADRNHQLAPLQAFGIAERGSRERHRLIDANEREIGIGVVADQASLQVLAVGGGHVNARGGAGDVTVGEDEAVRRHHDARARPATRLSAIVGTTDGKADHGRADPVDDVDHRARIGIEQRLVLGRNGNLISHGGSPSAQAGIIQIHYLHGISPCLTGIGVTPAASSIWELKSGRGRATISAAVGRGDRVYSADARDTSKGTSWSSPMRRGPPPRLGLRQRS